MVKYQAELFLLQVTNAKRSRDYTLRVSPNITKSLPEKHDIDHMFEEEFLAKKNNSLLLVCYTLETFKVEVVPPYRLVLVQY